MTEKVYDRQELNLNKSKIEDRDPFSFKTIISGVVVTVIGGIILAFIIRDAMFSPSGSLVSVTRTPELPVTRIPSSLLTTTPNLTQVLNESTILVSIEVDTTLSLFDGELFISVDHINRISEEFSATIGSPECTNQKIKKGVIGDAVLFQCGSGYDVRAASVRWKSTWNTHIRWVDFYVTKLDE